jgi:DNA polymerase III beta subunit
MQFVVPLNDLKAAMNIVKETVGTDSQGHEGMRIYVGKKGRVKLSTNDGHYATETWFNAKVKAPGKAVIKAKKFHQYISKLDVEEITVTLKDNGNVMVKSKRGQQTFNGFDESSFNTPPSADAKESITMSGRFYKQLIGGVAFAAGEDKNRPILEGVNIVSNGKSIQVTTTNGVVVANYKKVMKAPKMDITVGRKSLVNAMKIVKDDEKITLQVHNDTRFVVKVGDTSFHIPMLAGKYPNMAAIFPKEEFPLEFIVEKDDFSRMLERAGAMLDSKGILQFEKGKVILTGETDDGNFNEYIMANLQGKANEIKVDIKLLTDIVKHIDSDSISVGVRDMKPLAIRPESKAKHTCLLTVAAS